MLSIEGLCKRSVVLAFPSVFLFTSDGRSYAVISFDESGAVFGLYLVIGDEEYEAHAEYFCR